MVLGAGVAMGLIVIFTWLPRVFPPIVYVARVPLAPYLDDPAITNKPDSASEYKTVVGTMFWVGEPEGPENDYIQNHASYWDDAWESHFGGVDEPTCRNGYQPCGFTPYENPFYVALPYGERTESDTEKSSAKNIPWYTEAMQSDTPLLKNRWVEVKRGATVCYGQWEDVGPNEEDDFAYVFGSTPTPTNTFGEHAGIDLSPALFSCLGLTDNADVSWKFVEEKAVPAGPWWRIITTRGVSFSEEQ